MAPEYPPQLVVFDARFAGEILKGDLHYIEVPPGNLLRVRWDSEDEPENFQPVGGGVAYVSKTDDLQVLPVSRDSIPDDLGELRYRWSEGLNSGIPWMMFALILPHGHTLAAAEPRPARAKIFQDRLALYWILKGDDFGRTHVLCTLRPFTDNVSATLAELNRFCSGESRPPNDSIQIDDTSRSYDDLVRRLKTEFSRADAGGSAGPQLVPTPLMNSPKSERSIVWLAPVRPSQLQGENRLGRSPGPATFD